MSAPGSTKSTSSLHCSVPGCTNDQRKQDCTHSFHRFPGKQSDKNSWIQAIRREVGRFFKVGANACVCSAHFQPDNIKKSLTGIRKLSAGAIPSIFTWREEKPTRKPPKNRSPSEVTADIAVMSTTETQSSLNVDLCQDEQATASYSCDGPVLCESFSELPCHDYHVPKQEPMEMVQAANMHIQKQDARIKQLEDLQFSSTRLRLMSPRMVQYYTGLKDWEMFNALFEAVKPDAEKMIRWTKVQRYRAKGVHIEEIDHDVFRQEALSLCNQFFLLLVFVRTGSREDDLAERFQVSQSTVSRTIVTWANFLYFLFGTLSIFPSKQSVQESMPQCFQMSYPNTRIIIDCTEIKCQVPSALQLNSELYSSYKSHTTFKSLIGITPAGVPSFVSALYTGCISDKEIVKQSGILDLLEPGDEVMADKGFTIESLLAEKMCTLAIPPFLSSKKQFSTGDVKKTQDIARLRIHVERAIRRIKEFHVFDGVIPLSFAGTINQIWTVCVMLTLFKGPLY